MSRWLLRSLRKGKEILQVGHPLLRARAGELDAAQIGSSKTAALIEELVTTLRAHDGFGLAAPQIGHGARVIVFEITEDAIESEGTLRDLSKLNMKPQPLTVLINPQMRVLTPKKLNTHREGCLSIGTGTFSAHVSRFEGVEVVGLDRKGEEVRLRAGGWLSRILQHEIDHLGGLMYVDRMDSTTFTLDEERFKHPPMHCDVANDGFTLERINK